MVENQDPLKLLQRFHAASIWEFSQAWLIPPAAGESPLFLLGPMLWDILQDPGKFQFSRLQDRLLYLSAEFPSQETYLLVRVIFLEEIHSARWSFPAKTHVN